MAYSISKVNAPQSFYIGNVHPGKQIIVRGKIPYGGDRFYLNLQEDADGGDIVFHFNPRPKDEVVVRNAFSGEWMEEERDQPHFPFSEGRSFLLRVEVTESGFRTFVNGYNYVEFAERLPMEKAKYLHLSDGCDWHDLTFQDRYTIPYATKLRNNMGPGKTVRIRGQATDSDGFSLNLGCDHDSYDNCVFHFNPRPREGCVVKNSNLGGWGEEERDTEEFPFWPGTFFDCQIVAGEEEFFVYVNEKLFTSYKHRCSLDECRYFFVHGDVQIADVQFSEPLDDDFTKIIPSGLEKGDVIVTRGIFRQGGQRFAINFHNGYDADSEIAFHFNPRRDGNEIVMNHCVGGGWGEEEHADLPDCFSESNDIPFEVRIETKSKKFKCYANGKKVAKFSARGNVEDIKSVGVRGDAYINQVKLIRRLDKPYIERIPGNLRPGSWIMLQGSPKKHAERFAVNLRCGRDDDSDIAFHFNPRLTENCTIRNTCVGGGWQEEEREQPSFPFEAKDTFEIAISVQPDKFVTFVNGIHYIDYEHRLPLDSICHIQLDGEAEFFEPEFY